MWTFHLCRLNKPRYALVSFVLHVWVCISDWLLNISLPCSLVHFNCFLIFMSIWAFQRVSLSTWMCIHLLNQKSSKLFLNFVLYFVPKWFKVRLNYIILWNYLRMGDTWTWNDLERRERMYISLFSLFLHLPLSIFSSQIQQVDSF